MLDFGLNYPTYYIIPATSMLRKCIFIFYKTDTTLELLFYNELQEHVCHVIKMELIILLTTFKELSYS